MIACEHDTFNRRQAAGIDGIGTDPRTPAEQSPTSITPQFDRFPFRRHVLIDRIAIATRRESRVMSGSAAFVDHTKHSALKDRTIVNLQSYFRRVLLAIAVSSWLTPSTPAAQPREIGGSKQLFIDNQMVQSVKDVEFTLNPARRAERVLHANDPWASAGPGFVNVIQEGDGFRMWYEVWNYVEEIPGHWMSRLCYAVSQDGIHWKKPRLGQFTYEGSGDNNIIALGHRGYLTGHHVFIDPNAKSADSKYKMVFGDFYRVASRGPYPSISGAVSADGIHWVPVKTPDGIIMPGDTDTQNSAFYDPMIKKYVVYVRSNCWQRDATGKRIGRPSRRVARGESDDFLRFPQVARKQADDWRPPAELNEVLAEDEHDPGGKWGSGIYTSAATVYPYAPGVYLFFPTLMRYDTGECTIQFATSRDGIHIDRRFHHPYVPVNPNAKRVGQQVAYSAYMGPGMVRVKDEIWMYGCETDVPHDSPWYGKRTPGGIQRYVQRLDGFISLDARDGPGAVTTKPFFLRGSQIEINADANLAQSASTGSLLRVEVLGSDGTVLAKSHPLRSDGVSLRPQWQNRTDLGKLIDRPIQLRFTMRFAKLYAFQVVNTVRRKTESSK